MRYKLGTCQFQNIFLSTSCLRLLAQTWSNTFFILQSLERICIKGHGDQCGCKGGDWLRIRCIKVPSISEHHLFPQFLPNASISFQYFPNLHRIIFCTDWKRGNVKNFIHLVSHWKRKDAREVWSLRSLRCLFKSTFGSRYVQVLASNNTRESRMLFPFSPFKYVFLWCCKPYLSFL